MSTVDAVGIRQGRTATMPYTWTGVLITVVLVSTTVTANLLLDTLTDREVPSVINLFAVAAAVVATVVAFVAHVYQMTMARISCLRDTIGARLDQLEHRFGDYNAGFVAGYLLSDGPEPAPVVTPQLTAHNGGRSPQGR